MTVSSTSSTSGTTGTTSTSTSSSGTSSITTSGDSTTSSIDWSALITAAVDAKLAAATVYTNTITANEAKIAAYQSLQTSLSSMATDLASLSSSIINSLATNAFATRAATISSTGDVSASAALSMSVNAGAATGDHTLTVTQLATAEKVTGTTQSSQTDALGYTGTFDIGLAGGSSESISVTSSMSLGDVVDAINSQTSTTNVEASVIQVSDGSYQMVLTGTKDASDISYSSTSGDDILNKLGVTDTSGSFTSVLTSAQSAEFNLDGISLTRTTNDITDVLSGVTFNLMSATPSGTSINISIGADTDQITTAIEGFVTDYNAFRDLVVAQQATNSDGTASSSAVLFGDETMRDTMDSLQNILGTSVNGMTMADLGLAFNNNNELTLDTGTLSTILSTNLSGVTALLSAQTTTSSSQLAVADTTSTAPSFTLDLAVDSSGNLTSASVGGDSSLFTISGNIISGASGTAYAGMSFIYTGSTSQSINVTSTQGLAAQINQLASTASGTAGNFQTQIDSLTTVDTTDQSKVSDIQSEAATYQSQLQTQYASYQSAIQSADNMLNYLKAILNASSNN